MGVKISQLPTSDILEAEDKIPVSRGADNKAIRGVFFKTKRHVVINTTYSIGSHSLIDQVLLIDPTVSSIDITPSSVKPGVVLTLVNFLGAYGGGSIPTPTPLQLGSLNYVLWLDGTCTNSWDRTTPSVDIMFMDSAATSYITGFSNSPIYVQIG